MRIALIGYGKMGHIIEQVALSRGHEVVLRISSANKADMSPAQLGMADVAIEFTTPHSAPENVMQCLSAGISVVSGTTGWNERLGEAQERARECGHALLHASNFSIGVNIFFEVNKRLATLMNGHREYDVQIAETHHTAKKDAPSGTAITLAEQIINNMDGKTKWALNSTGAADILPIMAYRVEDVPGTHTITYSSATDDITLTHTAHNRNGFALGAVLAAEYIVGKSGVFSMQDVLGIK